MGSIRTDEENSGHIDGYYADSGVVGRAGQRSPILWQAFSALLLVDDGRDPSLSRPHRVRRSARRAIRAQYDRRGRPGDRDDRRAAPVPAPSSVLGLLFIAGTLLALVLALTVGLFGIHEQLGTELVPTTLIVESIGTIVLAVTTGLAFRMRRSGWAGRAGALESGRASEAVEATAWRCVLTARLHRGRPVEPPSRPAPSTSSSMGTP